MDRKSVQIVELGCIICGEKSQIEVPEEIGKALGKSVLIVCEQCSHLNPEEIEDKWIRRWLNMMP